MRSLNKASITIFILCLMQISCYDNPYNSFAPTSGTIKISVRAFGTGTQTTPNRSLAKAAGSISSVTITSARVVIDKIEFENSSEDALDFELEDPFVHDLVVGVELQELQTVELPYGSYEEMEIEIDDLDPDDVELYRDNPEIQDLSILVKGHLNGDPNQNFVFVSDLEEEQE